MRLPGYKVQCARGYARSGPVWQVVDAAGNVFVAKLAFGKPVLTEPLRVPGCVSLLHCLPGNDDRYAIVMEVVSGIPMSGVNTVAKQQYQSWLKQVIHAIRGLHQSGWIHGDINASNILVEGDRATVIDILPDTKHRLTKSGVKTDLDALKQLLKQYQLAESLLFAEIEHNDLPLVPTEGETTQVGLPQIRGALKTAELAETKDPVLDKKLPRHRRVGRARVSRRGIMILVGAIVALGGLWTVMHSNDRAEAGPNIEKSFITLVHRRDQAIMDLSVTELDSVNKAGSPLAQADNYVVQKLRSLGVYYRGLETQIDHLRVLTQTDKNVLVEATLTQQSYEQCVSTRQICRQIPAQPSRNVVVKLQIDPVRLIEVTEAQ